MQTLSKADADLFYKLWRPLLQYVNRLQKIYPTIDFENDEKLVTDKCITVAAWLWDHKEIIDDFLTEHPEFSDRERSIVSSWKQGIRDHFFIERHLKSGSIFINERQVFLVKGLLTSYEEMLWMCQLPVYCETTIIPFEDQIITDGLISLSNLIVGSGIRKLAKDMYTNAKQAGKVITSFPV